MIAGWTVTAFAITRRGPFWFDLLKHIMNIRAAAKKPKEETAPEESAT